MTKITYEWEIFQSYTTNYTNSNGPQVTRITPLASHVIHAWFVDVTNFVSLSFHFRLSVNRVRVIGEVTDSYPCDLRDNKESLVTTSHMR